MGIVPWVLRGGDTRELTEITAPPELATPEADTAFVFPDDQADLASGLPSCTVSVVPRRGASASESALKGRVIVVLESKHASAGSPPIDGHVWDLDKEEEQLLSAMLRSIGLSENDLCRAVPASPSRDMASGCRVVGIAELHRQVPRLVLLLLNRTQASLPAAHHRLDGGGGVIGWRLPHPAVLLADPERKREAWEVLKAIRQTLSPG